jgi:hypothetical protein
MSKGSKPRPREVDSETFESNWDAIFGKKPKEPEEPKKDDDVPKEDLHS